MLEGDWLAGDCATEGGKVLDAPAKGYTGVRDQPGLVVAGFLDTMDCDRVVGPRGARARVWREP